MGVEGDRRTPLNSPQSGDPMGFLDLSNTYKGGNPEMLLQIKAQLAFVESDTLPVDMDIDSGLAMDNAGVIFEEMVPGDDQFAFATLPDGWTKRSTHDRHKSELLDDKGRTRAVIVYKESFAASERYATLTALPRYSYEIDNEYLARTGLVVAVIKNAGKVLWKTDPVPVTHAGSKERATARAKQVLDRDFPGWENPAAYWDNPQK